jgi:hypothetical protein
MINLYEQDWETEREAIATGAAVVGTSLEILKSTIVPMTKGDIQVTFPTSPIGVTLKTKSAALNFNTVYNDMLIINHRTVHSVFGYEFVNVKLRCYVQYNGPEVQATFGFDAEGRRSRLGRDTTIAINNPLSLETKPTSSAWQRVGVMVYPVVRIPVEFRVDNPWPLDNHNETFVLVLSGMYGFGASKGESAIKNRRMVKN